MIIINEDLCLLKYLVNRTGPKKVDCDHGENGIKPLRIYFEVLTIEMTGIKL